MENKILIIILLMIDLGPAATLCDPMRPYATARTLCLFNVQDVSISVSVLTLAAISIDRYYAICYPLRFKSSLSKAKRVICLIWLLSLTIMLPDLIYLAATQSLELSEAGLNTVLYSDCNYTWAEKSSQLFQYVKTILLYVVPFVFMFAAHFRIMRTLRISTTTSKTSTTAQSAPPKSQSIESRAETMANERILMEKAELGVADELTVGNLKSSVGENGETRSLIVEDFALSSNNDCKSTIIGPARLELQSALDSRPTTCQLNATNTLNKNRQQTYDEKKRNNLNKHFRIKQLNTWTSLDMSKFDCIAINQKSLLCKQTRRRSWFCTTNQETANFSINELIKNDNISPIVDNNQPTCTKKASFIGFLDTCQFEDKQQAIDLAKSAPEVTRQRSQSQHLSKDRSGSYFCIAMHNKSQLESRRNAAKMLMAIVIFFGLTHLPVHVMNFLR